MSRRWAAALFAVAAAAALVPGAAPSTPPSGRPPGGHTDAALSPAGAAALLQLQGGSSEGDAFGTALLDDAAVSIGLGPDMLINPIIEGILGPTVQDLIQKLGNYMSSTIAPRLNGFLTGAGDTNRPVVLIWMIMDIISQVMAVVERVLAMVQAALAKVKAMLAQAKMVRDMAASMAKQAMARAEAAKALALTRANAAMADAQSQVAGAQAVAAAAAGAAVGQAGAAVALAQAQASAAAGAARGAVNGALADARGAVQAARAAALSAAASAAAMAQSRVSAVTAGLAAAAAATNARTATLEAAAAASAAQVAGQSVSLPPMEKEHLARIAAQAEEVAAQASAAATGAQAAAMAKVQEAQLMSRAAVADAVAAEHAQAVADALADTGIPRDHNSPAAAAAPRDGGNRTGVRHGLDVAAYRDAGEEAAAGSHHRADGVDDAAWDSLVFAEVAAAVSARASPRRSLAPAVAAAWTAAHRAVHLTAIAMRGLGAAMEVEVLTGEGDGAMTALVEVGGGDATGMLPPVDVELLRDAGLLDFVDARGEPLPHATSRARFAVQRRHAHALLLEVRDVDQHSLMDEGDVGAAGRTSPPDPMGGAGGAVADHVTVPPGRAGVFIASKMMAMAHASLRGIDHGMARTWGLGADGGGGDAPLTWRRWGQSADDATATGLLEVEARATTFPPPRAAYMEATTRWNELGATARTMVESLVHDFTGKLYESVSLRVAAAMVDALSMRVFAAVEQQVAHESAELLTASLAPALHEALSTTLPATLSRTLPPALLQALTPLLRTSLTRSVTHATSMALVAGLVHARMGPASPECAHCLAVAGGAANAAGGPRGSCDGPCWGGAQAHGAIVAVVDSTHSAAGFFADFYLNASASGLWWGNETLEA